MLEKKVAAVILFSWWKQTISYKSNIAIPKRYYKSKKWKEGKQINVNFKERSKIVSSLTTEFTLPAGKKKYHILPKLDVIIKDKVSRK
jgi:hypothetical protein